MQMTRSDIRLAAAEVLLEATAPWLDETALRDVRATLRADLIVAIDEAEREVVFEALRLLEKGLRRYPRFSLGSWVRGVS